MFGIGFLELCLIAVVALIFIGPDNLPNFIKQVSKFFMEARKVTNEVKTSIEHIQYEAGKEIEAEKRALKETLLSDENKKGDEGLNEENDIYFQKERRENSPGFDNPIG